MSPTVWIDSEMITTPTWRLTRPRPAHRALMDADAAMANLLTDALALPDWRGKHWAPITTATARLAEIRAEATS